MSDEQAKAIFLDSVNPADPARRVWAARWLNLPRTLGAPVPDFYAKWHALLEEAAPGDAKKLERTWPMRLSFGERVLCALNPYPRALHDIIWHTDGTVESMSRALCNFTFGKSKFGFNDEPWKHGCWFCKKFVNLCPPSSRDHPRESCPLVFHPYALGEAIVAAMRATGLDWRRGSSQVYRDLQRILGLLNKMRTQSTVVETGRNVLHALFEKMGIQLRERILSMVVPVIDEL
ncbi:hypothetical protein H9P43_006749 [Blastocladiella emersonii ATCC 22665]|nr:hypothetical protein H9P43_006749 [Blastocladiella emersonii ATCC 22665]